MPTRYAIRITEDNLDLIRVLSPIVEIHVKEDINRYFLLTIDSPRTTTEHDVVEEADLAIYDGNREGKRIIIK
jgi:hypothetical protein